MIKVKTGELGLKLEKCDDATAGRNDARSCMDVSELEFCLIVIVECSDEIALTVGLRVDIEAVDI